MVMWIIQIFENMLIYLFQRTSLKTEYSQLRKGIIILNKKYKTKNKQKTKESYKTLRRVER